MGEKVRKTARATRTQAKKEAMEAMARTAEAMERMGEALARAAEAAERMAEALARLERVQAQAAATQAQAPRVRRGLDPRAVEAATGGYAEYFRKRAKTIARLAGVDEEEVGTHLLNALRAGRIRPGDLRRLSAPSLGVVLGLWATPEEVLKRP